MTYTVEWLREAEDELTTIWLNTKDRAAVTAAANVIDARLRTDPDDLGESRPEGRRILFCKPLGVLFRVRKDQRLVLVGHVWEYR